MTKFTEGEWVIDKSYTSMVYITANGHGVCEVDSVYDVIEASPTTEQIANAHLIAAAPNGFDLGELVIKMCDHHEGLSPNDVDILYQAAKVFIEKCKGK